MQVHNRTLSQPYFFWANLLLVVNLSKHGGDRTVLNVALFGAPGSGKSHLASDLLNSATSLGRPVVGAIAGSLVALVQDDTARALRHPTGGAALGGSGIQAALSSRAVPAAPASAAATSHSSARRSATDAASELSPDAQTVYLHCSPYARASCLQLFEVFVIVSYMQMRHGRSECRQLGT